jgi:hypothetical protein
MNETTALDLFVDTLRPMAAITMRADVIEIAEYEGVTLDPPVKVKVEEISLERYIAETSDDAQEALGVSTSPKDAAVQLLCVNLEEMILTRKGRQQTLVLMPDGLEWEV